MSASRQTWRVARPTEQWWTPSPFEPEEAREVIGDRNSFLRTKVWIAVWMCIGLAVIVLAGL